MKKLYKRLAATFLLSAILSVFIFAVSLYKRGKEENGRYLDQLLTSAENNLTKAAEEYAENLEHLKEDYINKAREIEYIAANETPMINRNGLEHLKEIMETGDISLLDEDGNIFLSTNQEMQGTRENDEALVKLRDVAEDGSAAVYMDQADFQNRPEYFYAIAGSESERFAAVRVDADLSRTELMNGKELVGSILRQATTEHETSIAAVGKERGRIFGITENNSQKICFGEIQEGTELLEYLAQIPEERAVILFINGAYQSAVVRNLDEMYLVAFSGLERVVGNVLLTFWLGLAAIGMISILTVMMVHYHLKKYLFGHFEQIREGIYGVMRGERNLREDDNEIPELRPLMEMIFQLEQGYMEKTESMDQMVNQLTKARTEAEYDRLTGLYNRRGFERRAEAFLKRENPCGVLVLLDIDNFKQINDLEGHPEGDRTLQQFARCLMNAFRKEDIIGRMGGDEFIVLICGFVPVSILEEKFASLLENIHSSLKGFYEKYQVSASIGAVPADGNIRNYKILYRCADTALYISKYLGKDRYYINEKRIACMRRECIRCREDCPRSRLLN
ncbi:MAG TPA: diguanylate cyclase [Candidatus Mediterraneibacter intestinigallinarum]|nr:diguanylate cyclase [Candidatus Mediterraneibacter intestinigallinarum]